MKPHTASASHLPSRGVALQISGWLTGIYFVIELFIGLYTGSIAVISDAFHTFSAVGGIIVAMVAAQIARRPADPTKTFGWYRAEIIGALVNGAFLLVMALIVIVMGVMRLSSPIELPTGPMLLAAAGGLFTEFISIYLLYREQGNDLNVRGAFWHVLQTFVGSIIIIIAALVIQFTGFLAIDPILGILFGFILLWASWDIMRDAIHLLMEGTPKGLDIDKVTRDLLSIDGVLDLHHVHAWALTSNIHVFSAHLKTQPGFDTNAKEIQRKAHTRLKDKYGFFFSTLQIETECLDTPSLDIVGTVFSNKDT